jgi:hypothetical protein
VWETGDGKTRNVAVSGRETNIGRFADWMVPWRLADWIVHHERPCNPVPGDFVSDRPEQPMPAPAPRKSWIPPKLEDLPRLENLTLQTGGPIDGGPSIFP